MYHNKKVLKASDQLDILWLVSSACYLRRHRPECFGRVKRTLCLTGAIDILLGVVVRRPINLVPGVLFLWIIFSVIFKSVQSSTCWQNGAGSRVRFSPGAWKFPLSRASMVSPPSKLKMFNGSVCVLLTSLSLKLIKIKIKSIYASTRSWEENKMAGER